MVQRIIRILLCKNTMDVHDRGVRYLATKLRQSGMEVVFINFFESKEIFDAAIQEDVDVIGVSSSVEGHLPVARDLTARLKEGGKDDVLVLFGGVIPDRDVESINRMGVRGIFGPGSTAESIVEFIHKNVRKTRVFTE